MVFDVLSVPFLLSAPAGKGAGACAGRRCDSHQRVKR